MQKKLTVIPEQCSGCGICELVCAIKHFGVNNPKKAAIRVLITYPHPVVRMRSDVNSGHQIFHAASSPA